MLKNGFQKYDDRRNSFMDFGFGLILQLVFIYIYIEICACKYSSNFVNHNSIT
jgi:hypothetical protein